MTRAAATITALLAAFVAAMLASVNAIAAGPPSSALMRVAPTLSEVTPLAIVGPPVKSGEKLDVAIGIHVINISSIDEVAEQFALDAYLVESWKDQRLAYTPNGGGDSMRYYSLTDLWIPKVEIVNAASPRNGYDTAISVSPDGTVTYNERFRVMISSQFRLHRFPFDQQTLLVIFHPFINDARFMKFGIMKNGTWTSKEFSSYSSLAQWEFEGVDLKVGEMPINHFNSISEARFEINMRRKSSFYVWKVFLPLLLMVFLSWAVFWIETGDIQTQVTIAVTTILTVIAFAFAISATMPRVPYLTYIDAFFLHCYVFVFIAMVELMLVHMAHRTETRRDLGIRMRRVTRYAIPAAFVASNVIIAIHFLG
jgi:hypothetical protein